MRLISCYIEGFGKYQDARFDFSNGLTAYHLENGEGKTTLAAFLRAMLYGMPTDRGDAYGVRSRYYPFQGGSYGGQLQIEWQGKRYTIARAFDKKSAAKDALRVLDERGQPCSALGEIPGETLFGLKEEAFIRTSYITWQQVDIDLGNGIGERLGGMAANASTVTLEKALDALEKHQKTYHSGRRKGEVFTGRIPDAEEKIEEIKREIYRAESAEQTLATVRKDLQESSAMEGAISAEIEKMQEAGMRRTRWESYRSLLSIAEEEEKKARALAEKYPLGFPTLEEQKTLKENADALQEIRVRKELRRFVRAEELAQKEAQFAQGVPSAERVEQLEMLVDQYMQETREDGQTDVATPTEPTAKAPKKGLLITLLVLAIGLLAAGVALIGAVLPLGVALLVCGVVALLLDMLLYVKSAVSAAPVVGRAVSAKHVELRMRLEDIFSGYAIRDGDMASALRTLKADVVHLQALRKERADYDAETEALAAREQACFATMQDVLARYALQEETWLDAGRDGKIYAETTKSAAEKRARAEDYRVKAGLTEEPQVVEGMETRKQEHRALQERVRELRLTAGDLQREAERLPRLRLDLEEAQEALAKYLQEKELVAVTIASLSLADTNLKDRYLLPMQESFLRYAKLLGAEWADAVSLDDDLQVQFEARGQLRRAVHLSDGQRALAALCMRLSLMENIHKGEMPFCILDDPFVHLDEKHFAEVAAGVRALAENRQIVYFTCHSSRAL